MLSKQHTTGGDKRMRYYLVQVVYYFYNAQIYFSDFNDSFSEMVECTVIKLAGLILLCV